LLSFSSSSSPCNSATTAATTTFSSSPTPDLYTFFSTDSRDDAAVAAVTISSHSYNTQHTALLKPIIILHHIPHTHCYFPRLPLLSAFGVGFYLENLPALVAVIARSGPSSSPPTGEASKLH
jgi:hypothetical protein